jgi:hypothetical protein
MRGVSLEELSSATRISTRFLTAIEKGHWEELPGGAFNRGFIRSASHYLGLDEDGMVAEYSLETSNGIGPLVSRSAARRSRAWARLAAVAGMGVLLIAGGWFAGSKIVHRLRARTSVMEAGRAKASDPLRAAPATPGLSLVIRVSGPAEVGVEADGKAVFEGQMRTGDPKNFRAKTGFRISTDNAGAVRLELNGQPLAPMGLAKSPGRITLTAKDLKSSAGGSH